MINSTSSTHARMHLATANVSRFRATIQPSSYQHLGWVSNKQTPSQHRYKLKATLLRACGVTPGLHASAGHFACTQEGLSEAARQSTTSARPHRQERPAAPALRPGECMLVRGPPVRRPSACQPPASRCPGGEAPGRTVLDRCVSALWHCSCSRTWSTTCGSRPHRLARAPGQQPGWKTSAWNPHACAGPRAQPLRIAPRG